MQFSEQEVTEAAEQATAAMVTIQNDEFLSQFIRTLGTDPKVMPSKHHQAIYGAILSIRQASQPVNVLSVWESLENVDAFQGGVGEMARLHSLIVESEPADIFVNNMPYFKLLVDVYEERKNKDRALRIVGAGKELDSVILAEADRIIAKQKLKETDIDEMDRHVPFPEELLFDVFKPYAAAFQGRTEVPMAFHFAVLKTVIGASLGRRVYLDAARPIYPNFYTVLVGQTGVARKSTALRLGEAVLGDSDPAVLILRSLSTPEGLLQIFCPPEGYKMGSSVPDSSVDPPEVSEQMDFMLENAVQGVEGFRVLLSFDEFSYVLKKASKSHGEGLIQTLTEAYDYPTQLDLPTRVNPLSADHPCLSIMAATTHAWLESTLKLEDIQGGFANRFCYYHGMSTDFIFKSQPGDDQFLNVVKYSVNQYRQKFLVPTAFQFDEDADREGEIWYIAHREALRKERNPLIREALARTDINMYKAALLHAAITNDSGDFGIGVTSLRWAIQLAEYLQTVTTSIYQDFNLSETRRLEQRIVDLLSHQPNQTARELAKRISWASAKEVNQSLEELVKNQTVAADPGTRTTKYHVLTEL